MRRLRKVASLLVTSSIVGCGSAATLPVSAGTGPSPTLPAPHATLIPLVHVATAEGWGSGDKPVTAPDLYVAQLAAKLDHPRWLYVLPNGDVLVAETNAPPKPDDNKGLRGWFFKKFMAKAGGAVPSANRITLLRDADGDGVAETRSVFLSGLNVAVRHGARRQHALRRQQRRARARSRTRAGRRSITARRTMVTDAARRADQPSLDEERHRQRRRLEDSTSPSASNSNVGENGIDKEAERAAIWEVDPATGAASRLRVRPAQSGRHGVGAGERRALGVGERARRARQRSRSRLHDVGARRRVLRLAVQLLRPARRHARPKAAASRSRRQRRSCPTTRSVRTPRRSGSRGRRARRGFRRASPTGCSSASTARGIESRAAATR